MSRSALWHQERNVQRRQEEAEELWQQAVDEGKNNRAKNLVFWDRVDDRFNFNPMLLENIKKTPYFINLIRERKDFMALVDEIYYNVENLEPWAPGAARTPSTGFCLLLRLLTLRCSYNQMTLLLDHRDSPYIRAIGFLYLRYACDPTQIFGWIQPYLYDDEPVQVLANKKGARGGSNSDGSGSTIGEFVRSIFSSTSYHGTTFPRLPIQIERDLQVKLLQADKVQKRAETHFRNKTTMEYFQNLGSRVMATYEDEENPLQWYEAVVDRVIWKNDNGDVYKYPRFIVTFSGYGNTETVTLGEMDLPGGSFHREEKRSGRGNGDDLYEEVRRRERETVTATSRGEYARAPPSTKTSLTVGIGRNPPGDRSRGPPPDRSRSRSPHPPAKRPSDSESHSTSADKASPPTQQQAPPPRKRTAEELAKIHEKKRKLLAKYG